MATLSCHPANFYDRLKHGALICQNRSVVDKLERLGQVRLKRSSLCILAIRNLDKLGVRCLKWGAYFSDMSRIGKARFVSRKNVSAKAKRTSLLSGTIASTAIITTNWEYLLEYPWLAIAEKQAI